MQTFLKWCDRTILWGFYGVFFLVPIVLSEKTSELFELNKIWVLYGLSICIITAWITKMILRKRIILQRTIFDIPLFIFLLSQLVSTIFSLDPRVSFFGYYSRFNGGFLSLFTYILLYYALLSNIKRHDMLKILNVILLSCLWVALWGFPSHFGSDPTCLLFRGTFDVNCWTEAFRPTIRIFSTLGQPAWMAAYLAALIPLVLAYTLKATKSESLKFQISNFKFQILFLFALFLYIDLLFANTRAGYLAFLAANLLFWAIIFFKRIFSLQSFIKYFLLIHIGFGMLTFLNGVPLPIVNNFTLPELSKKFAPAKSTLAETSTVDITAEQSPSGSYNVTDSGDIRLIVWDGAIRAWQTSPFFGTGVETFAFAYYKNRPVEHNLTSEWDYLYNKAHNEYLNYLTTTGVFGLGSYLFFITFFLLFALKKILTTKDTERIILGTGLVTGVISILISNFFGFSVVIINLFLFLFPAFFLLLFDSLPEKVEKPNHENIPKHIKLAGVSITGAQWTSIFILFLISGYLVLRLWTFWLADTSYALGYNYDRAGALEKAFPKLQEAVALRSSEPVFKDELSNNMATIGTSLLSEKDATARTQGKKFIDEAVLLSNDVIQNHPNNVVFWKSRVKIFYTLAQLNPSYLPPALQAIQKASELAPTDVKIAYNYGVLLGQNGQIDQGIQVLEKAAEYKPNYRDVYFALGLFYHEKAISEASNSATLKEQYDAKAEEKMNYILEKLEPNDTKVKETLESWK